ncbi:MAG: hypothetical protein LBE21_00870 [Pseudomonadales bacterium]|jgi:hypothetical protein|nr:hypothetical protein [Pseudomonadales bacterium]
MKISAGFSTLCALLACLTLAPASEGQAAEFPRPQALMPGVAANAPSADEAEAEAQARVSRREASDRAREAFPNSRVLNIRLENGQWILRMDQGGNVFNVLVDANTGRVRRAD